MNGKRPGRKSASTRNVNGNGQKRNGSGRNWQRKKYRNFVQNWSNIKDSFRKPVTRTFLADIDRKNTAAILRTGRLWYGADIPPGP